MEAQYPGACAAECGQPIRPGQKITPDADGQWQHVRCPNPPARHPRCGYCGLEHPGEC